MSEPIVIKCQPLSWSDIIRFIHSFPPIAIDNEALETMTVGQVFLSQKIQQNQPIYGINTGFGKLCNIQISPQQTQQLQHNLLVSHAVGTGPEIPPEAVRLMFLFKVKGLVHSHSGIHPRTIRHLLHLYHHDALPIVPSVGSLGASGDLAPLAHFALPLIGLGGIRLRGRPMPAKQALAQIRLEPLTLGPKEGLALINGTQFMTACGTHALYRIEQLFNAFLRTTAFELEAFDALATPFHPRLNALRQHPQQQQVATFIRSLLADSSIFRTMHKPHVQDPYSFRCIPQVYGTVLESIEHFRSILLQEINSITDNPHLFPDLDQILSGGNFHGQRLAWAADSLALGIFQLSAMAERRMYQLISGTRGLPPFLTTHGGLHSGMMIIQYTTAALINRIRQLSFPISNHSLTTSLGQEDHVSMGGNAIYRLYEMAELLEQQIAYQLLVVLQALRFRPIHQLSSAARSFIENMKDLVPPPTYDTSWENALTTLRQWALENLTGSLPESIA